MSLKKWLFIVFLFQFYTVLLPTPVLAQSPSIEASSATGTIAGGGTTMSITLPSGTTSGDLLVACVAGSGDDTSNISASGWTHVITAGGGGTSPKVGLLYRFWQPGDSATALFTISSGNTLALRRGVMWRISGADESPSGAVPSFKVDAAATTSRIYQGITTNTDEALLLGCLNWSANDSVYTPDADLSNTVTQNRHAADYGVQTIAGATGNFTGSGNGSPYASVLWAVTPGSSPINNVPTITLDGPSDMASDVSTSPTFTFTGTDADDDDLTYEIQITDNPNDFIGGEVLGDSFSGGGGASFHPQPHPTATTWQGDIQVDDRMCQSFTALGGKWSKAVFPLGDSRVDTSGTSYARIYEHAGIFGTSSAPANAGAPLDQTVTGNPTADWLAQSDGVLLGPSFAGGNFDFSASGDDQIRFEAGSHYLVCGDWIPNNNLENNTWAWSGDAMNGGALHDGNLYHDGYLATNHGVHADWDLHFSIYESFTLNEAQSSSDPGFTNSNNGADASPFTAGDQLTYELSTELEEDITYYWRARVSDGTVTSDWSTTQSFTTAAAASPTPTPTPTPTPDPTSEPTPTPSTATASSDSSSSGSASHCSDQQPTGTPDLFQITTTVDTAKVFFTPIAATRTYYISYAISESAEEHGIEATLGDDGVQSYTIEKLQPETTYYFKVRGQNGCATGGWSQTLSAVTTRRLGIPSILFDDSLVVTKVNRTQPKEMETENETELNDDKKELHAYDFLLTVMLHGKPLVGAAVELHSDPRYGTTDENGQVLFTNVEKGEHTLKVSHGDYKAEQTLNIAGDSREFSVSVTLEVKESWLPNWAWVLILIILSTVIVLMWKRNFNFNKLIKQKLAPFYSFIELQKIIKIGAPANAVRTGKKRN